MPDTAPASDTPNQPPSGARAPVSSAPPPRHRDRTPSRRSRLGGLIRFVVRAGTLGLLLGTLAVWLWNRAAFAIEPGPLVYAAFATTLFTSFAAQAGLAMVVASPVALLAKCRCCGVALLVLGVTLATPRVGSWINHPDEPLPASADRLTVYSANLLYGRADLDALLTDLERVDADVVLLQEVQSSMAPTLATKLEARYPHAIWADRDDAFGEAVLSRVPFSSEPKPHPDRPLPAADPNKPADWLPTIGVTVEFAGREIDLWDMHPPPPMRERYIVLNDRMSRAMAETVRTSANPVVLAGDFNAPLASPPVRRLLSTGLEPASSGFGEPARPSWPTTSPARGKAFTLGATLGGTRIDHVLHSPQLRCIATGLGANLGTDHRPVWATLEWAGD